MINSLVYWLKKLANNEEKPLTQWQIRVIFKCFEKDLETIRDEELKLLAYPLIQQILSLSSRKHKSLIAKLLLNLINDYQSEEKEKEFDPDTF